MRKIKGILILAAFFLFYVYLAQALAKEAVEYGTYANPRFDFSVRFPKDLLTPQGESENGDGNTFLSEDQQTKLSAWGDFLAASSSWKEEYQRQLRFYKDAQITYKVFKKSFFVISGYQGEKIFYYKELLVTENGDEVILAFQMEYPKKDRGKWDGILKTCANSLKQNTPFQDEEDNGPPAGPPNSPEHAKWFAKQHYPAVGTPGALFTPVPQPDPPTHFQAETGDRGITLVWDPMPRAIGYVLFGSEDGIGFKRMGLVPAKFHQKVVALVENGKTFYYGIESVGPYGEKTKMTVLKVVPKAGK